MVFPREFISPSAYSEDSSMVFISHVGTDRLGQWLWVSIAIHQTLLKYYLSKEVASFQVAMPSVVMPFVFFFLEKKKYLVVL